MVNNEQFDKHIDPGSQERLVNLMKTCLFAEGVNITCLAISALHGTICQH